MSESDNISTPQESTGLIPFKALDERLYDLSDEERSFLKEQSGIQDDYELKEHVIQVQTEAYKVNFRKAKSWRFMQTFVLQVHPYPCIRLFNIARWVREREGNTDTIEMRILFKAQDLSSVQISGLAQDRQITQGSDILRRRKLL